MSRQEGFTLVEALVAVAVVCITTAAMPSLADFAVKMRVQGTIDRLHAGISHARMSAVAGGLATVICPRASDGGCGEDGDWSSGWITFIDPDGDRRPGSERDILEVVETDPGRVKVASTAGRRELRYLADGRSAGSNLTLRVCDGRAERLLGIVVINNSGRARSERIRHEAPCQ